MIGNYPLKKTFEKILGISHVSGSYPHCLKISCKSRLLLPPAFQSFQISSDTFLLPSTLGVKIRLDLLRMAESDRWCSEGLKDGAKASRMSGISSCKHPISGSGSTPKGCMVWVPSEFTFGVDFSGDDWARSSAESGWRSGKTSRSLRPHGGVVKPSFGFCSRPTGVPPVKPCPSINSSSLSTIVASVPGMVLVGEAWAEVAFIIWGVATPVGAGICGGRARAASSSWATGTLFGWCTFKITKRVKVYFSFRYVWTQNKKTISSRYVNFLPFVVGSLGERHKFYTLGR